MRHILHVILLLALPSTLVIYESQLEWETTKNGLQTLIFNRLPTY